MEEISNFDKNITVQLILDVFKSENVVKIILKTLKDTIKK